MIIPSSRLQLSYQDLEDMFNAALEREIQEWQIKKNEFFKNLSNRDSLVIGNNIPTGVFKIWLDVPKNMVSFENLNKLLFDCSESGWDVESEWQEDERTGADQIYFLIKKK